MSRAAKWGLGLVAGLLALLLAALWFADTSTGHRLIVDRIERLAPANGLRIKIGRIEGSIYGQARLVDVRLADPRGEFFQAPEARLDWRPRAWLADTLDIRSLVLPQATLVRLPQLRDTGRDGPLLPGFDIRIGRLEVQRLRIGRAVTGVERVGSLRGNADIRDGRALVRLDARTDAGDRLALNLDSQPDANKFDLAANVTAPARGVLGALVGIRQPLTAQLAGQGTYRDWRGRLFATASGQPLAGLDVTAQNGRYGVNGAIRPALLVDSPRVRQLTAPQVRITANATAENRRVDLRLNASSAALQIAVGGIVDLAESAFDNLKIDGRVLQPNALVNSLRARDLRLQVMLDGRFSGGRFDYLLTTPQAAIGTTGFDQVRASGQGRWARSWPVNVPLRLTARRVTGVGEVAGGLLTNLSVDGVLRVSPTIITGDGLRVRSDKLDTRLTVLFDLTTGLYQVGVSGALNRYLIPGLGIVDVKSELRLVPGPNGVGTRILGSGQAWVRRLDNGFLRSLAGGLPYIETGLERTPDGLIRFINLRLRAPTLRLQGNGYRRLDGTFFFEGSGVQGTYGPVRLTLDGPISRPRVDLRLARPLEALALRDVRLRLDPIASGFAWRAVGAGSRLGPFRGNGALVLPAGGGPAVIQIAELNASGLRASGALRSLPGGFDGQLALSGAGVNGSLAFRPQGGVQRLDANLTMQDARLAGPPLIAVRRGTLRASLLLDPRGTSVDATFAGTGVRYGSLAFARLDGTANLRGGSGTIRADLAGAGTRPYALQTIVQVAPNRFVIQAQGTLDRRPLRLVQPAVVTRVGNDWVLSPTAAEFAGGFLRVGGRFGANTAFDATVERLPLNVLDIVAPDLRLGGLASGRISYRQSGNTPSGSMELRVRGLSRAGLTLASSPIDAGVNALLTERGLALRAVAVSGGQVIGRAQMRAAPPAGGGDIASRVMNAPLFAQVRFAGAIDSLWRTFGVSAIDLSGPVALGADVRGTLRRPQIAGAVRTDNLRIESAASGTVLTGVKAAGRFSGSQLLIEQFAGTAGRGTITGRARFDLAAANGFAMDISGQANNAEIIRRDDIGATVTGPLFIRSSGADGVIGGDVVLNRSAYRLGQASAAAAVPQLRVREINRRREAPEPAAPPTIFRLDIKARAPNRLAVSGLGLDSEWRGDLDIGGLLTAPAIRGRVELVRGGFEFAGRRFELQRGVIRFQGASPPDPVLDIVANANIQQLNATVRVSGTGQRPEINFESSPPLPQDELLSRLLFGTSITNLSAPEAFQLAAAVASLRGGGGLDPINRLRHAVGLDRLRILPADATTGQRTAIAAGKYITRRAYVEVISDGSGYTATRVEFEITRWLSILSTISNINRQSVNVRVSKDY